jgi:hypothetical protein
VDPHFGRDLALCGEEYRVDEGGYVVSQPRPRRSNERSGAYLGPDLLAPVPLRTLSDDYRDVPAEPEDSDRVPDPELPGLARRMVERLSRRFGKGR